LRGAPLDYRKFAGVRDLIDYLRLADTMTTAKQDGKPCVKDVRSDSQESVKVYSHVIVSGGGWFFFALLSKYSTGRV
jgi:hypothetical protein